MVAHATPPASAHRRPRLSSMRAALRLDEVSGSRSLALSRTFSRAFSTLLAVEPLAVEPPRRGRPLARIYTLSGPFQSRLEGRLTGRAPQTLRKPLAYRAAMARGSAGKRKPRGRKVGSLPPVEDILLDRGISAADLVEQMELAGGFGAKHVGEAAQVLSRMRRDAASVNFLS